MFRKPKRVQICEPSKDSMDDRRGSLRANYDSPKHLRFKDDVDAPRINSFSDFSSQNGQYHNDPYANELLASSKLHKRVTRNGFNGIKEDQRWGSMQSVQNPTNLTSIMNRNSLQRLNTINDSDFFNNNVNDNNFSAYVGRFTSRNHGHRDTDLIKTGSFNAAIRNEKSGSGLITHDLLDSANLTSSISESSPVQEKSKQCQDHLVAFKKSLENVLQAYHLVSNDPELSHEEREHLLTSLNDEMTMAQNRLTKTLTPEQNNKTFTTPYRVQPEGGFNTLNGNTNINDSLKGGNCSNPGQQKCEKNIYNFDIQALAANGFPVPDGMSAGDFAKLFQQMLVWAQSRGRDNLG